YPGHPSTEEPAHDQISTFNGDEEGDVRSKRRSLDIGAIFVLFVVILPVIFLIMILYLRASLPSPENQGNIYDLKHRVSGLSDSLATCTANSSRLFNALYQEETHVEVLDQMLDQCRVSKAALNERLNNTQEALNICVNEEEDLKRQVDRGAYVQFLDYVGKTGTGGDSWVCSDSTPAWSYGYTSTNAPHPSINIQTWISDMDDVQHSTAPLIFPPIFDSAESYAQSQVTLKGRGLMPMENKDVPSRGSMILDPSIRNSMRIVGYTVKSLNTGGHNGWWRISKPPAFGVEGGTLEFFAVAGKLYRNSARFKVMVYWSLWPDM
ncbi:hypothetical protein M408DRAFT_332893, partial [Serendipita vermifera MAFF 305830]